MQGKHIVIEGPDKVGKTTQCQMLQEHFFANGMREQVEFASHPGSTRIGGIVREITRWSDEEISPLTESLLFALDSSAFFHQKLAPAIQCGVHMISDRINPVSGLAYSTSSPFVKDILQNTNPIDLLIILDNAVDNLMGRMDPGKLDRYESRGSDFLNNVRCNYISMLDHSHPLHEALGGFVKRAVLVQCQGVNKEQVFEMVLSEINKEIKIEEEVKSNA